MELNKDEPGQAQKKIKEVRMRIFGRIELQNLLRQLEDRKEKERRKYGLFLGDGIIPSPKLMSIITRKYAAIASEIIRISFKGVLILTLNANSSKDDDLEI